MATRPGRRRPGTIRWRWFLAVGSLVVAAVLSLGWSFQSDLPASGLERGLHLGLLVALPLYSLGLCLATVVHPYDGARSVAAAVLGGMVGVLVVGTFLVPRFEPMSVYLFCVLCVSGGALARNAGS